MFIQPMQSAGLTSARGTGRGASKKTVKALSKAVRSISNLSDLVPTVLKQSAALVPAPPEDDSERAMENFAKAAENNVGAAWMQVPVGTAMDLVAHLNRLADGVANNVAVLTYGLRARAEMEQCDPDLVSGVRQLNNLQQDLVLEWLAEDQKQEHPVYGKIVPLTDKHGAPHCRSNFLRWSLSLTNALVLWRATARDHGESVEQLEQLQGEDRASWNNCKTNGSNIASLSFRILLWALQPDELWQNVTAAAVFLHEISCLLCFCFFFSCVMHCSALPWPTPSCSSSTRCSLESAEWASRARSCGFNTQWTNISATSRRSTRSSPGRSQCSQPTSTATSSITISVAMLLFRIRWPPCLSS